jgi:TRAP-type transport system periplasmic protein
MNLRFALLGAITLLLAAPASAEKTYEIKFGSIAPDDTPWSQVLWDFKEEVEKDSGGRVKVTAYLNGALGDEKAMLQKMRFGQLNMGGFSTGGVSTMVPELQVLELPGLFKTKAEADYIIDTVLGPDLEKAMEAKDLKLWIWGENGWLDFGAQKEITGASSFGGTKVAMQESAVQLTMYDAIGVKPTPLPIPEILGGLQTGLVDTYASSPIFATAAQWFAYTKHWADSDHMYQPAVVVFSKRFWDGLPADLQTLIMGYAPAMTPTLREAVRGMDAELYEGFSENGIVVRKWSEAERDAFAAATKPSHAAMVKRGDIPQALLDKVYAGLAEFRAR